MFLNIGTPLSLTQIQTKDWNIVNSRPLIPIAIIDDQKFPYSDMLRQVKFNIIEVGDITDIKHIKEYGVIICDIQGVGKAFGSKYEGGYVIKEIRKHFPDKYIIAFSGSRFDPTFKRFLDECDITIKKDADTDDWTKALDTSIEELSHPIKRWIRARNIFLNNNMELIDVFKLEQAYIKAIARKETKPLENIINKSPSIDNNEAFIEVGISLINFLAKLANSQ